MDENLLGSAYFLWTFRKKWSKCGKKRRKNKVHFSHIAHVILIPCLDEYKNLHNDLWYNIHDYQRFETEYLYS